MGDLLAPLGYPDEPGELGPNVEPGDFLALPPAGYLDEPGEPGPKVEPGDFPALPPGVRLPDLPLREGEREELSLSELDGIPAGFGMRTLLIFVPAFCHLPSFLA